LARAEHLGYFVPPDLPLLPRPLSERSEKEVVDRLLTAFAFASIGRGLEKSLVRDLFKRESIDKELLEANGDFCDDGDPSIAREMTQVLGWFLGLGAQIDYSESADLGFLRPIFEFGREFDAEKLRARVRRKSPSAAIAQLDLANCILASLERGASPADALEPSIVRSRFAGLHWLFDFQSS
jgi:hypothetical protein